MVYWVTILCVDRSLVQGILRITSCPAWPAGRDIICQCPLVPRSIHQGYTLPIWKRETNSGNAQSHSQLNGLVYSKVCFYIPNCACNVSRMWVKWPNRSTTHLVSDFTILSLTQEVYKETCQWYFDDWYRGNLGARGCCIV